MKKLSRLQFIIGLVDKVSGPIQRIQQRFEAFTRHTKLGLASLGLGMGVLATSGYAVANALEPARDVAAKIGEVASLDVPVQELKRLEQTALLSSAKYGTAAADFVGASYDIQSAISGLKPGQLGDVTDAMNTLAVATKSDVADMTSLMGSMYGIFENEALAVGVDRFSSTVAAYTAKSVQMFKTTGKAMEDAFRGIGSLAKTHGISMQEQFAVLGSLQATMPGAEAGTKYKAFLAGVVKAQDKLKMTFTDSHGKMLPIVDILEKIKAKYGELDSNEIGKLSKAFGSEEAVMVLTDLIGKTDKLKSSIGDIGTSDFALVQEMAGKIADPADKATTSIQSLTAKIGGLFLPTVNAGLNKVAGFVSELMVWMDANPKLVRDLTRVVLIFGAVIVGLSTLAIVFGVAQLAAAGFAGVIALLTSPITLIVLGVVALAAGAIYLYRNWECIKASLSESRWGKLLLGLIDMVLAPIRGLIEVVTTLYLHWDKVRLALSNTTWGSILLGILDGITWPVRTLVGLFTDTEAKWNAAKTALSDTTWGKAILSVIDMLMEPLRLLVNTFEKAKGFASEKWSGFKSWVGIESDTPKEGAPRALGGSVMPNHLHRITERGPEVLQYGNEAYLLNGGSRGNIVPFPTMAERKKGGGFDVIKERDSINIQQLAGNQKNQQNRSAKQQPQKVYSIKEVHLHTPHKIDAQELKMQLELLT